MAEQVAAPAAVSFDGDIRPLLATYCFECHGEKRQRGDLNLAAYADAKAIQRGRQHWLKVWHSLHTREMPPEDKPQPTLQERQRLADWIERTLNDIDCDGVKDPGRIVLRRLTRYEYRNTIRDLVGVDFYPASEFPADDVGYGFDNIGDVLSLPPLLLEKYLSAAEAILDEAIVVDANRAPPRRRFRGDKLASTVAGRADSGERWLLSNGEVRADARVERDGRYVFRVRAWGTPGDGAWPKMSLKLNGRELEAFEVAAAQGEAANYEVLLALSAGEHQLAAAFTNDYWDPRHPDPSQRDRNLVIQFFELRGPVDSAAVTLPESHRRIFELPGPPPGSRRERAAAVIERFATRAFRRPVNGEEVQRYVELFDAADEHEGVFEQSMKVPLMAVLVSPHFLFRIEGLHEPADDPIVPLGDHELATRLSYFLWSSTPDEELMSLAGAGQLRDEKVLEAQVHRMLADPKAMALAENFATQWLQLRRLRTMLPDAGRFPSFTPELREAMYAEVVAMFDAIRREDRSVLELIDTDILFINESLAHHYGLPAVSGPQLRPVTTSDRRRGGILTSAAVLTVTSNPTRTNPTRRGKWVLETVLGTPPPPPVPDVGELEDIAPADASLSVRELLELHRADANCAGCHSRMDPIGFAFERYDAIGAWRETEDGFPIDDSASLPDGRSFAGPVQFKDLLLGRADDFARALAEKMLTYALGRGLEYYDVCAIRDITGPLAAGNYRFSTLVAEIVRSYPFRHRRTPAFTEEHTP